jgi:hypothetical protein
MNSKSTRLLLFSAIVLVVGLAAGAAFDQWRAKRQEQSGIAQTARTKTPPLPQWGALLPEGDDVEVSGSAMCGYCTWRVGEAPDNLVLQMSTEPGIVFVVGNQKRAEIEKKTGACADGSYWITARGSISQYNGHNYLLVKNYEMVKTK